MNAEMPLPKSAGPSTALLTSLSGRLPARRPATTGARNELVVPGKMTERQFHDAVLRENAIPIELVRASLTGKLLGRDFKPGWRFADAIVEGMPAANRAEPEPATRPASGPAPAARGDRAGGPRVYLQKIKPHWFDSNNCFWYRNDLAGGRRQFILVDAGKGMRATCVRSCQGCQGARCRGRRGRSGFAANRFDRVFRRSANGSTDRPTIVHARCGDVHTHA